MLLILSACLIGNCFLLAAKDDNDLGKDFRKSAKRFRFRVKTEVKFPKGIRGKVLPVSEVEEELEGKR